MIFFCRPTTVDDGSHNVSRWMTWLPISLKNAAKCDKWYQLQNLSITESLNANGTWKKALVVQLQVCHDLSVEQKPKYFYSLVFSEAVKICRKKQILCLAKKNKYILYICFFGRCSGSPKQFCTCLCKCDNELKTAISLFLLLFFFIKKERKKRGTVLLFSSKKEK